MKTLFTRTENNALQRASSGSRCLDFFAEAGSARRMANESPHVLLNLFANALAEDAQTAMAIMFWVRAVREGAGQRDVFHTLFLFAHRNYPEFAKSNLELIGQLGYFKDYIRIFDAIPELEEEIADIFAQAIAHGNGLACKWLPREHKLYSMVRARMGMNNGPFRRFIAGNSNTVEQKLCAGLPGEIDYSQVPSKAFNNYRKLFLAKDKSRFLKFVVKGKINTAAIYPHEILDLYFNRGAYSRNNRSKLKIDDIREIINAQWNQISNFIHPDLRFITVLDTSGSMMWGPGTTPGQIAYSLAVYCAENQEGYYKNKVISFSKCAQFFDLENLPGVTEKIDCLIRKNIAENTDIASVFQLILHAAITHNVPREQLPNCVLILSDMQFDEGAFYEVTLMEELRLQYKQAGYDFPAIIYWNLEATNTGIAAGKEENVSLVSGYNPKIMEAVFMGMKYEEESAEKNAGAEANPPSPESRKVILDPLRTMEGALAPLREKIDYALLPELPPDFAACDFNQSRGQSFRRDSDSGSDKQETATETSNPMIPISPPA